MVFSSIEDMYLLHGMGTAPFNMIKYSQLLDDVSKVKVFIVLGAGLRTKALASRYPHTALGREGPPADGGKGHCLSLHLLQHLHHHHHGEPNH